MMPLIEPATTYLLATLTENEEFKKFPQDFITESVKWVRSWFIKDDPITEAIVNLPGNEAAKEAVVKTKLPTLLEQPQFKQELESKVAEYERHAANIVQQDNSQRQSFQGNTISVGGNADFSQKKYDAKGDINMNTITNYHYHTAAAPPEAIPVSQISKPTVASGTKQQLQDLIASNRMEEAIRQLRALSGNHADFQKMVLHQSSNWEKLNHDKMMGIISYSDADLVRNKIVNALLGLVGELGEG